MFVDGANPTDQPDHAWPSVMVDVSDLSLTELAEAGDDVLAHCLRRLVTDLDRPGEPIAGFNSAF